MAQTYNMISLVAFSLAGVGLLVTVFIWFKFRIWEIIGDLSGRTAKKSIKQMRAENEKSGKKGYRPTPVAMERGGITEAVEIIRIQNNETEKLTAQQTGLENITELLSGNTELLEEDTEVLEEGTVLLEEYESAFDMEQDIILIHTNETI